MSHVLLKIDAEKLIQTTNLDFSIYLINDLFGEIQIKEEQMFSLSACVKYTPAMELQFIWRLLDCLILFSIYTLTHTL